MRIAAWISEGSGWRIVRIIRHYINIVSYRPLRGKSYISLPKELHHHKKGLINLKHEDNECFRWCHIRHLNPVSRNPDRITKRDRDLFKKLDYSNITFPVTVKDVNKIEKQNSINIKIFGYDERVSNLYFKRKL